MKTRKFSKIVLLVLSLALLIGSAVGIAVSAEDNSREILSQNIIYSDRLTVMYAVDATLEEAIAGDVRVSYYWEEDGVAELKAAKLLYPYDENDELIAGYVYQPKDGEGNVINTYPVFITEGVPAKDLLKVANVTAYAGELPAAPVYESYSVAEYLYTKLYRDGYIAKTEVDGKDYERKLMYTKLLDYGAQAQTLLVNYDKAEAEREPLVTESEYVLIDTDNITVNGGNFVFIPAGKTVSITPAYLGEDSLVGWEIYKSGSCVATIEVGESYNASSAVEFIPQFAETVTYTIYDFETNKIESGTTIDIHNYSQSDASTYDERTYIDDSTERKYNKGAFMSIAKNPLDDTDKVLKIDSATVSSAKLSTLAITPDVLVEGGKIYVLEFDVTITEFQNSGRPAICYLIEDSADAQKTITAAYTTCTNSKLDGFRLGNSAATQTDGTTNILTPGTWAKTRLVYDIENGKYYTYYSINGGYTWVYANESSYSGSVDQMGIYFNVYNCNGTMYIDDLAAYVTDAIAMTVGGEQVTFGTVAAK